MCDDGWMVNERCVNVMRDFWPKWGVVICFHVADWSRHCKMWLKRTLGVNLNLSTLSLHGRTSPPCLYMVECHPRIALQSCDGGKGKGHAVMWMFLRPWPWSMRSLRYVPEMENLRWLIFSCGPNSFALFPSIFPSMVDCVGFCRLVCCFSVGCWEIAPATKNGKWCGWRWWLPLQPLPPQQCHQNYYVGPRY